MFVTLTLPIPGVARVTLTRPERMNALSMQLAEDLITTLERVRDDVSIGVMILTGAGRGFCAGGDIKEMEANREKTLAQRRDDLARMHLIPKLIREMPQIAVAAVNGAAYGAGFAVALNCDLVVAGEGARFGSAFLKQGLVSDFGLSYQLTRLAGPAAARRIIFLDEVLSASEAKAAGLVAAVVPDGRLDDETIALAERMRHWPVKARAGMKGLLFQAETVPHQEMLDTEARMQSRLLTSQEHADAVDAFLGKFPGTAIR